MKSYLLISRLYQLHCCNKILISLYDGIIAAGESRKEICLQRLKERKTIKAELKESLLKLRNEKGLLAEKVIIYLISTSLNLISDAILMMDPKNHDSIMKWESKNIHFYYNTLYTQNSPKEITNMLLRQKEKIERYALQEIQ